jgi:hypothetical protein
VREWLKTCDETHGSECYSSKCPPELPRLTVIDVINSCLVTIKTSETYVALSYVWGNVQQLQTTKANVSTLRQPGGLASLTTEIPIVIQDAMTFVLNLGLKHLWVDSLCIVQDDERSKASYISRMDIIYSCAYLTFVAVTGINANTKLPGATPGSRLPQPTSVGPGYLNFLFVPSMHLEWLLQDSHYESRGWTFQERFLSRRCLYFTANEVWFECGRERKCEVSKTNCVWGDRVSTLKEKAQTEQQ